MRHREGGLWEHEGKKKTEQKPREKPQSEEFLKREIQNLKLFLTMLFQLSNKETHWKPTRVGNLKDFKKSRRDTPI